MCIYILYISPYIQTHIHIYIYIYTYIFIFMFEVREWGVYYFVF